MPTEDCEIALATAEDIAGILDLQGRNQPERGGTLSARLPREWLEAAVAGMPVIVARKEGRVVGHLISASRERMGMREVAGFTHGGAEMAVLAYVG